MSGIERIILHAEKRTERQFKERRMERIVRRPERRMERLMQYMERKM